MISYLRVGEVRSQGIPDEDKSVLLCLATLLSGYAEPTNRAVLKACHRCIMLLKKELFTGDKVMDNADGSDRVDYSRFGDQEKWKRRRYSRDDPSE